MQDNSFGYWLKRKRKALDLTQGELANQVGCSAAAIRKIEAEERHPSAQIVGRLAEIFDIPGKEQTAFLRFARGDWKSAPAGSSTELPWEIPAKSPRFNIPATTTSLIAREKDLSRIGEYLLNDSIRLVTLMGPPGIGKTRLGIDAARAFLAHFTDGVFFVALAPLADPTLIPPAIAQALGFVGVKDPVTEQIKRGIANKHMLLVMDNCEHLIDDLAALASDLLSTCPHLKILATSRESLRISGEWLYPVPVLDAPKESSSLTMERVSRFPALILFAERARAVCPEFALHPANIDIVSRICSHLDGLPLAIELIAARMRLMTPQALLERLNDHFILSADGMRAASVRQKTLNDAIGWSYHLLSGEEQRVFAYLSVFSGGFTLDAAERVLERAELQKPVGDLIASLADKSLLQYVPPQEEDGHSRYTMLVTIQQFAKERLQEMGQEVEIQNRHLAYFLEFAEQADQELRGPNQLEWLHRLSAMRDNLRAAQDWAVQTKQTENALQMLRKLDWFWFIRSDHTQARQQLQRVLEMPEITHHPSAHAEMLTLLAHHIFIQVGENQQRPVVDQALQIARTHGDKHNTARALVLLGLSMAEEKNFAAMRSAYEESKTLYQQVHDEWGYAHAVMCLGYGFYDQGDTTAALVTYEQALMVFRKLGDRFFENVTLRGIAIAQTKLNHLAEAKTALQEALIRAYQLDSKLEIAGTLSRLGEVEQRAGNFVRAVCLFWAATNLFDVVGAWTQRYEFDLEKVLAPCRIALTRSAFAEAVKQGRTMPMEQAITYALEEND